MQHTMTNIGNLFQIQKNGAWDAFENDTSAATAAEEGSRRSPVGSKGVSLDGEEKQRQKLRLDDVLSRRRTERFNDTSSVAYSVASLEPTRAKLEAKLAKRETNRRSGRSTGSSGSRVSRAERMGRNQIGLEGTGRELLRRSLSGDMAPRVRRALSTDIGVSTRSMGVRRCLTSSRILARTSTSPCCRPMREKIQKTITMKSRLGSISPDRPKNSESKPASTLRPRRSTKQNSKKSIQVSLGPSTISVRHKKAAMQKDGSRPKLYSSKSCSSVVRGPAAESESRRNSTWKVFPEQSDFGGIADEKGTSQSKRKLLAATSTDKEPPSFYSTNSQSEDEQDGGLFQVCSNSDSCLNSKTKLWVEGESAEKLIEANDAGNKNTEALLLLQMTFDNISRSANQDRNYFLETESDQDAEDDDAKRVPDCESSMMSLGNQCFNGGNIRNISLRARSRKATRERNSEAPILEPCHEGATLNQNETVEDTKDDECESCVDKAASSFEIKPATREARSLADTLEQTSNDTDKSSGSSAGTKKSSRTFNGSNSSSQTLKKKPSRRSGRPSSMPVTSSSSNNLEKLKVLKASHELLQQEAEDSIKKMRSTPSLVLFSKCRTAIYDPYEQDIDETPSVSRRRNGTFTATAKSSDRWLVSKSDGNLSTISSVDHGGGSEGKEICSTLKQRLEDLQTKWNQARRCLIAGDPYLNGTPCNYHSTEETFPSP